MLNLLGIAGDNRAESVESTGRLVGSRLPTNASNPPVTHKESTARLLARVTGLFHVRPMLARLDRSNVRRNLVKAQRGSYQSATQMSDQSIGRGNGDGAVFIGVIPQSVAIRRLLACNDGVAPKGSVFTEALPRALGEYSPDPQEFTKGQIWNMN